MNYEQLKAVCNPSREDIAVPFSFGDYSYATNGHIMLRLPRMSDVPDVPDAINGKAAALFDQLDMAASETALCRGPLLRRIACKPLGSRWRDVVLWVKTGATASRPCSRNVLINIWFYVLHGSVSSSAFLPPPFGVSMNAPVANITLATQRFVDNSDDTITDTSTGLMWSKATITEGDVTHATAAEVCALLDLAGHRDWRLPTIDELFMLADRSRHTPAIDTAAFPDTRSDWYWTSTICAWSPGCAWIVNFNGGLADGVRRDGLNACVRAVRSVPAGQ